MLLLQITDGTKSRRKLVTMSIPVWSHSVGCAATSVEVGTVSAAFGGESDMLTER